MSECTSAGSISEVVSGVDESVDDSTRVFEANGRRERERERKAESTRRISRLGTEQSNTVFCTGFLLELNNRKVRINKPGNVFAQP